MGGAGPSDGGDAGGDWGRESPGDLRHEKMDLPMREEAREIVPFPDVPWGLETKEPDVPWRLETAEKHPQNRIIRKDHRVYISAKTSEGLDELLDEIDAVFAAGYVDAALVLPYDKSGLVHRIESEGTIKTCEYKEDGIHVFCQLRRESAVNYLPYMF